MVAGSHLRLSDLLGREKKVSFLKDYPVPVQFKDKERQEGGTGTLKLLIYSTWPAERTGPLQRW